MEAEKLIGISEAAKRIGMSEYWMRELLRRGEIPSIRIGEPPKKGRMDKRRYLIVPSDIDKYLTRAKTQKKPVKVADAKINAWRQSSPYV